MATDNLQNGRRQRRPSAVLSMPNMFRATELIYESKISKFPTYLVEEKDSMSASGEELLMKSIKNEKCVAITLKWSLDQIAELEHFNLPRIRYQTYSDNYSYIVFEKPPRGLEPLDDKLFKLTKHDELLCRSIIYELARTIQYTHAYGTMHRDLRANNVFVDIEEQHNTLRRLMLIDFGATKALLSDDQMAILNNGIGYPSATVRKDCGQYPAPEILMDLKYDGQVDAWFLGVLLYQMLNGGSIPFMGDEDDEIQESILQGGDNKFSLLRDKIDAVRAHKRNGSINERDDKELKLWMDISDDVFDLITGLLTKDARQRYTVDEILWSDWIPKCKHEFITKRIVRHWLHRYRIPDDEDALLCVICNYASVANNIRLSAHGGEWQLFNRGQSVLHQFKVVNSIGNTPFVRSDAHLSVMTNIWCKSDHRPITIEYLIEYAKEDCFIGLVADDVEPNMTFEHFIGGDDRSLALSIRFGTAWHNGEELENTKRIEYLPTRQTLAQRAHNIQQTTEDVDQLGSPTDSVSESRFGGPPPLRKVRVAMRIDSASRTLSFMINDKELDPLYFDFNSVYVSPAFTLCHCMDQVTITSVQYDEMEGGR